MEVLSLSWAKKRREGIKKYEVSLEEEKKEFCEWYETLEREQKRFEQMKAKWESD